MRNILPDMKYILSDKEDLFQKAMRKLSQEIKKKYIRILPYSGQGSFSNY